MAGEAPHVELVHDGPRRRTLQRGVALPVVHGHIEDDALHRRPRVVTRVARVVPSVRLWNCHSTAVRIQKNLGRIEAHPARRIEWALDAIAVYLTWFHLRHECVPVVIRSI